MAYLDHEAILKAYPNVTLVDDKEGAKDKDGNVVDLDDSTVAAARTQLDSDAAKVKYKSDRASSYASIGEQLDMQYWDALNGTTTWKDHVAKVKADNPKPS